MTTQISTIASNSDFKVNLQTGEAYISQRKTAELTGIPKSTVNDWILREPDTYNLNENNQLDAKSLQKLVLTGHQKGYEKCADLVEKLMEAGATAFICHMAGLTLQPTVNTALPQTHIEAVRAYLVTLETVEAQSKQLGIQAEVIQHKQSITNDGTTYFTIARIRELNPDMKLSGQLLNRESDDQEIPAIKQFGIGKVNTPYSYHKEVWEAVYPDAILPE